jgi:hypothetical protein
MAGLNYPDLIDDFERSFIRDMAHNYQRFGAKTRTSPKQLAVLEKVGHKLCVFD